MSKGKGNREQRLQVEAIRAFITPWGGTVELDCGRRSGHQVAHVTLPERGGRHSVQLSSSPREGDDQCVKYAVANVKRLLLNAFREGRMSLPSCPKLRAELSRMLGLEG